jgi:hypothetical protein
MRKKHKSPKWQSLSGRNILLLKECFNDLKIVTKTVGTAIHAVLTFCYFSDCRIGGLALSGENTALQSSNACKSFISFGKH